MSKYSDANAEGGQPSSPSMSTLASSGLDLLFAASQVKTKPNATTKAEADSVNAVAEVPSTVTVVSTGTGTGRAEPGSESVGKSASNCAEEEEASSSEHDGEKPTNDAVNGKDKKDNVKTFPQVLQIILNTPEYESIAHWLPDGLSFIIADKQRFSDEILPKYFRRGALFHSFIRKLNRYGFRRVKGSCKGEESSFAHNDFVRDKPLLCLKMNCQSKPTYHKAPSAKKKSQQAAAAAVEAINNNRLASAAGAGLIAMPTAVSPTLMAGGMIDASSRAFVATSRPVSYLPAVAAHSAAALPMTTAVICLPTNASTFADARAAAIQERQLQLELESSMLPADYNQRILHEKQMLLLRMRQRHHRQVQLQQRLQELSAYDEDHYPSSSYDSYIQSSLMAQSTRDMLRRNIYY